MAIKDRGGRNLTYNLVQLIYSKENESQDLQWNAQGHIARKQAELEFKFRSSDSKSSVSAALY